MATTTLDMTQMQQQSATIDIHTRALLVFMTISMWSARRYDKTVTQKVNAEFNAFDDAGRYNKMLLPGDAPSYKALTTIASQIRAQHYKHTLAWSDEGWRLLPTANYMDYTDWLRTQEREFQAALDAFVQDYPALKQAAQTRLNGMFKDEDYPSVEDIRRRFAVSVSYMPVPVPAQGDIRVNLTADQVSQIEDSITAKVTASVETAARDARQRLYDVTSHMAERLANADSTFRTSTVTNVRECCEALQRLNVTNDPQLEEMRLRVERDLTVYEAEDLRGAPTLRSEVADKAQTILDDMKRNGYIL